MLGAIFKKKYTLRRQGKQTIVNGYPCWEWETFTALLNVQPLTGQTEGLPEGVRSWDTISTIGNTQLRAADQESGHRGDQLFYQGKWYECQNADYWDHTAIAHCEAEFVLVPENELGVNAEPPTGCGAGVNNEP